MRESQGPSSPTLDKKPVCQKRSVTLTIVNPCCGHQTHSEWRPQHSHTENALRKKTVTVSLSAKAFDS